MKTLLLLIGLACISGVKIRVRSRGADSIIAEVIEGILSSIFPDEKYSGLEDCMSDGDI